MAVDVDGRMRRMRVDKERRNGRPERNGSRMPWEEWLTPSSRSQTLPKKKSKEELLCMPSKEIEKTKRKKKRRKKPLDAEIKRSGSNSTSNYKKRKKEETRNFRTTKNTFRWL